MADELVIKAKAEVIEQRRRGNWDVAMRIEFEEKFIDRLSEEIEQAPNETEEIKKMEARLQAAETTLNDLLVSIEKNEKNPVMTRDDLLRMAHELVTLAKAEILEQRKAGKKAVAAQLEQQEKVLLQLADQIEAAIDDTKEIEAAAEKLKVAERTLREKLRSLENAA
jgi:hypothetical protein